MKLCIPLLNKIYKSRAKLIFAQFINPIDFCCKWTTNEKKIKDTLRSHGYYNDEQHKDELIKYYYKDYSSVDEMQQIFKISYGIFFKQYEMDGIKYLEDITSKYCNVINHRRLVTNLPEKFDNHVYFFGNCTALGVHAEDKYTVQSYMQRNINKLYKNKYCIVNHSAHTNFADSIMQILNYDFLLKENDIVIILITYNNDYNAAENDFNNIFIAYNKFSCKNFLFYQDLSKIFKRPHKYGEVFFDNRHVNYIGYSVIAQNLTKLISKIENTKEEIFIPNQMIKYVDYLKHLKHQSSNDQVVGCVVMNCNPFTLGHKYLIDEAIKRCDFLYVFILDEDKSYFSFDIRFSLVKLSLKSYKNVYVIPTGKIMISSETLPEYFQKEINDSVIDASLDLYLFVNVVAKILNITKRFAGDEPFCKVTSQYNIQMREYLPKHGVEFIEIPRLKFNNEEISASKVRTLLYEKDFISLKNYLPKEVLEYIIEREKIN